MKPERNFMLAAIKAAEQAGKSGDYPIGSVIVKNGKILSVGKETLFSVKDPTGHAEIWAIRKACKKLKTASLKGCEIYSTHEPCPMCTGAILWSGIDKIIFGAGRKDMITHMKSNLSRKFHWNQINVSCAQICDKAHYKPEIKSGFMRKECLELFALTR